MPGKQVTTQVVPAGPPVANAFVSHPLAPIAWSLRALGEQLRSTYPPSKAVAAELHLLRLRLVELALYGPLALTAEQLAAEPYQYQHVCTTPLWTTVTAPRPEVTQ